MPADWRYNVTVARLPEDLPAIHYIRRQVFIVEQGIPADLEWDGQDSACHHVLATDLRQAAVGTGRLDPEGRIGRMAVLAPMRGGHIGRAVLDALLQHARERGDREALLHAQLGAAPFYSRAGFIARGPVFEEAGIPHVEMVRAL